MGAFKGTIIEESLVNKDVLRHVKILGTKVERVTDDHQTPWLKQWTLHTVEVSGQNAQAVAEEIGKVLDYSRGSAWYADFKDSDWHYIIFKDKIFKIGRWDEAGYQAAKEYGMSLGIPERQVDFSPEIN